MHQRPKSSIKDIIGKERHFRVVFLMNISLLNSCNSNSPQGAANMLREWISHLYSALVITLLM